MSHSKGITGRDCACVRRYTEDDELFALAAEGKLRLGEGSIDDSFWLMPAPRISAEVLRRVLEYERGED